jgi:hypothetical protein
MGKTVMSARILTNINTEQEMVFWWNAPCIRCPYFMEGFRFCKIGIKGVRQGKWDIESPPCCGELLYEIDVQTYNLQLDEEADRRAARVAAGDTQWGDPFGSYYEDEED